MEDTHRSIEYQPTVHFDHAPVERVGAVDGVDAGGRAARVALDAGRYTELRRKKYSLRDALAFTFVARSVGFQWQRCIV